MLIRPICKQRFVFLLPDIRNLLLSKTCEQFGICSSHLSAFCVCLAGHLWRHKHAVHPDAEEVKRKIETGKYACHFEGCEQAFACHSELVQHAACHTG